MKLLAESIVANKFTYKLLERIRNFAIYETSNHGNAIYEVVQIQNKKAEIFRGTSLPEREVYPSSSQWGKYGFTFTRNSHLNPLKAAKAKLAELASRQKRNAF
jgi:hypothetical protein